MPELNTREILVVASAARPECNRATPLRGDHRPRSCPRARCNRCGVPAFLGSPKRSGVVRTPASLVMPPRPDKGPPLYPGTMRVSGPAGSRARPMRPLWRVAEDRSAHHPGHVVFLRRCPQTGDWRVRGTPACGGRVPGLCAAGPADPWGRVTSRERRARVLELRAPVVLDAVGERADGVGQHARRVAPEVGFLAFAFVRVADHGLHLGLFDAGRDEQPLDEAVAEAMEDRRRVAQADARAVVPEPS